MVGYFPAGWWTGTPYRLLTRNLYVSTSTSSVGRWDDAHRRAMLHSGFSDEASAASATRKRSHGASGVGSGFLLAAGAGVLRDGGEDTEAGASTCTRRKGARPRSTQTFGLQDLPFNRT